MPVTRFHLRAFAPLRETILTQRRKGAKGELLKLLSDHFAAGLNSNTSFAAAATALSVNGNARGVTARQSAS